MANKLSIPNFTLQDLQIKPSANGEKEKKFCNVWPVTKTGLKTFQELTGNPFLKAFIGAIIAGGDTFAKIKCKV